MHVYHIKNSQECELQTLEEVQGTYKIAPLNITLMQASMTDSDREASERRQQLSNKCK